MDLRRKKSVRVTYRLMHAHDGGEIPNYHAWYMPGNIVYGDKVGNLFMNGESDSVEFKWALLECDNPTCSGLAIVSIDELLSVPLGVVLPDPAGTIAKWEEETGERWEGKR